MEAPSSLRVRLQTGKRGDGRRSGVSRGRSGLPEVVVTRPHAWVRTRGAGHVRRVDLMAPCRGLRVRVRVTPAAVPQGNDRHPKEGQRRGGTQWEVKTGGVTLSLLPSRNDTFGEIQFTIRNS